MKRTQRFFLLAAAVSLLVTPLVGCDSKAKKGEIPKTAENRLTQLSETLPANSQFGVIVPDLEKFRSKAKSARSTVDRIYSMDKVVAQAKNDGISELLKGDEMYKAETWKSYGIAPNSGAALGYVDFHTVLTTYIDDKKKFNDKLLPKLESGLKDAETKTTKIGEQEVKHAKVEDGEVYWAFIGKQLVMMTPADRSPPGSDKPTPTKETFKSVLEVKKEKSLNTDTGFANYKKAAGDRPVYVYFPFSEMMRKQMLADATGVEKQVTTQVADSIQGFGLVTDTKENRIETRFWIGLTKKGKKYADDMLKSEVTGDWTKFTTKGTLAGMRMAGNWKNVYDSYKKSASEEDIKQMEQQFAMAKKMTGLDIQKDVIDNLTGQTGLYVYGIGGKASMQMMANPLALLPKLEALFVMKFGDAKALTKVSDALAKMGGDSVTKRPLKGKDGEVKEIQVIEAASAQGMMKMASGFRVFVHEDTLALAAPSVKEPNVHKMLTGKAEGSVAGADTLDLGAKFAEAKHTSALWLNFERVREIFGDMVASLPSKETKDMVNEIEEVLISTEQKDNGAFVDFTVDLVPAKK
jgi:hypothetical protein